MNIHLPTFDIWSKKFYMDYKKDVSRLQTAEIKFLQASSNITSEIRTFHKILRL